MKTLFSIKSQKEILSLIADINEHGEIKFNLEKLSNYVKALCESEAYKKRESFFIDVLKGENHDKLQRLFNFECTNSNCGANFDLDVEKLHIATNEGFIKFDTDDYDRLGGLYSGLFQTRNIIKPYTDPYTKEQQSPLTYGYNRYTSFFDNAISVSENGDKLFLYVSDTNFFYAPQNQINLYRVLKVLKIICADINSKF